MRHNFNASAEDINNGTAEDSSIVEDMDDEEEDEAEEILQTDLEAMSKEELVDYATKKGLSVSETMSKEEIIKEILDSI